MKLIDSVLLDTVTESAKSDTRLRRNYNFHSSFDSKAQRLLNALEPGTVIPAHRHLYTSETYVLLRGKLKVRFYNDEKEQSSEFELDPNIGVYGVDIPKGQWHSIEVLESGTVIFEVKDGPYTPLESKDTI